MTFFVYTFAGKVKSDTDAKVASYLFEESKKQYPQQQENIEIINNKCFDVRYKMVDVSEAKKAIDSYNSHYNTGSSTLDVVLTEKSSRCLVKNIAFTSMGDGSFHGFGTKSIARIVEKYGGKASFEKGDDLFTLLAVFFETQEDN